MRVLHIWNPAGVASTLAKYQVRILGWSAWVITRRSADRFGLTTYGELLDCGSLRFLTLAVLRARRFDVIHVHMLDKLVPALKAIYPRKKVVLHYHGSDIRGRWCERRRFWKAADLILVSTPDLLEGAPADACVRYLPNPVDTDLFKPIPSLRRPGTALFITSSEAKHRASEKWAVRMAERLGLKLHIIDRDKEAIPHRRLPLVLNAYEYFIDHRWVPALSKTALEALACGLKVVRWDGKVIQGLPERHRPGAVVRALASLYEQLRGLG